MCDGEFGETVRKSMDILVALGDIYGASKLVDITSAQVSGVSYKTIGQAGLEYLEDLANEEFEYSGINASLNPPGTDLDNWEALGFPKDFSIKQNQIVDAYGKLGISKTCTCTPYLVGNVPRFRDHVSWSESSAVAYVNSVIGARTNREGGPAALAAAIEAVDNGAESVIVIEKTATTGGSLNFTSGSMSGAETIIQEIDGVEDTKESYVQDILNNGANLGDKELIEAYVEEDVAAIQWLWDNGLSDNTFSVDRATGTMSVFAPEHALYSIKRTYKASAHDASKYKSAAHEILDTVAKAESKIVFDFQTEAKTLINNEAGQVLSVVAENAKGETVLYTAKKGLIMATGGYSGNLKMMGAFTENGENYLVGGSDAADGYGIYMMQNIGAYIDEEKMGYVPTFPMGLDTGMGPGKIASTYMWKNGAISVNQEGNRFVKETEADPAIREVALEQQTNAIQYDIFTDNIIESVETLGSSVFWNFYYAPGMPYNSFVVEADSIEELAEKINVDPKVLRKTFDRYCELVEKGVDEDFGKPAEFLHPIQGPKYAALRMHPCVVVSFGGLETDNAARVLRPDGSYIQGLYAAGEVAGTGMYGTQYPTCGTSIGGALFFGRNAGRMLTNQSLL